MKTEKYIGKEIADERIYGKVTGKAVYCGDMQGKDMVYMRLKQSDVAHGRIIGIDTAKAQALPGVLAVYTCMNTPEQKYDRGRVASYQEVPTQERLFDNHVRFYGERVAAVVAQTEEIARNACDLIVIEYEPYKAFIKTQEAMENQAPLLHEEGNVRTLPAVTHGDYENCDAGDRYQTQSHMGRITHLSMETMTVRARFEKGTNKLTVWSACQSVFGVRCSCGDFLGLPYSKIQVIKPLMGGSFGARQEYIFEPLVAYAAKDLGADVMLALTREEQIVNTVLKTSVDFTVESKVTKEGTILGLKYEPIFDAGAYQTISPAYGITSCKKISKVYRIPNLYAKMYSVCTNTPVNGSFRSWGSSDATFAVESHMNHVAKVLGIDPVDFRLQNVMEPEESDSLYHVSIGDVYFKECLEKGREAFDWDARKVRCAQKNAGTGRYRYGVGMAVGSHTSSFYPYKPDAGIVSVKVTDDGSVIVNVCVHDHGCGSVIAMKKIVAEVFEIDPARVEVQEANSEVNFYDIGCYASRTIYVLGEACRKAAVEALQKAKIMASLSFGCFEALVQYAGGIFYPENNEKNQLTLAQVENYALSVRNDPIYAVTKHQSLASPGVAAAHFTEVEVDTFSGMVRVVECLSVHDIGKVINPALCRGQVGSGIQQGIGMALNEWIKIDPKTGKTLVTNFKNYEVLNAGDMPEYKTIFIEHPSPDGPFGAKSLGEVVVVPVAPAVVDAVNTALGTALLQLPLVPAVILEAINGKGN